MAEDELLSEEDFFDERKLLVAFCIKGGDVLFFGGVLFFEEALVLSGRSLRLGNGGGLRAQTF